MVNFIFSFIINIFDILIFKKYLKKFICIQKTSDWCSFLILLACATIESILNQLKIPNINLIATISILIVISLQYVAAFTIKLVLVSLYIGLGFITEPLGLLILTFFSYKETRAFQYNYYFAIILVEIIRFLIVHIICQMKFKKIVVLPKSISRMLIVIPSTTVLICCLIIRIAVFATNSESILLCILIILAIISSNYFLFYIFNRFNYMAKQKHEDELYIQEMKHKEAYYAEVQECNENVQNIKHDLKNQLGVLYNCIDNNSGFAKAKIKDLFCELENVDQRIYTENAILNSILNIKFTLAKERGIRTDVKVQVPINIMIDCGDLGIVYGNLLDNAIEACEKVYPENRYITLASKYIDGSLILEIKNRKTIEKNENLKTSKSDKISHGRGIKSVKKVVKKYNGTVKFEDFGEDFEVSAIFYGI